MRPFGFNAMVAYLRELKKGCESPLTGPAWVEGKSRKGRDLCRHLCKKWRGWLEREDQRVLREAYRPFGEEPPRRKKRTVKGCMAKTSQNRSANTERTAQRGCNREQAVHGKLDSCSQTLNPTKPINPEP